ncbi:prolyl oligopeptidase family serine peptidase [Micromonospora sp. NBC_01796]|uniref:prolyl oligopeptidase family serine peptidase n=1 Tax=Micromonospora sp. NBC_01796 TaxID=2975987 RepID=UPI002DD8DE5E|nr:prolyl oligopeptidase family serine peptidase [Micromonospora sp. NBC_01796]WSA88403.1 prolyl oligopeptidase family serine peptidase [Micromonospora sp. NBC_01796]
MTGFIGAREEGPGQPAQGPSRVDEEDTFRWLEDLDSAAATAWVADRSAETLSAYAGTDSYAHLRDGLRQVLDADDRIAYPTWRGEFLYNLWQDATHPRGLWRRTTLEQYRTPDPQWQILLDLDDLARRESESWVWQGADVLPPDYRRCLVSLSRGGSDAVVVREFDLVERAFVADGFVLPEAKSDVGWIDSDHVFVGTDFGPGSLTDSGYPRLAKRWRRGTPLAEAEVVFEGQPADVAVQAGHDHTPGFERDFVYRLHDFYRAERFLLTGAGELVRIEVPDDARTDVHREWLLIRLRSDWTVDGVTYPEGAVLVTRFADFLAGGRDLTLIFEPGPTTSLRYHAWTRNHLILAVLDDVRLRLEVLSPDGDGWRRALLDRGPGFDHADVVATNPDHTDEFMLSTSGFLQPATLRYGQVGAEVSTLKQAPSFFDPTGLSVRQFFATSADGTRVPYFVVGPPDGDPGPTLLTGYGGFEVSMTPDYDGITGRGWLARGGTYVLANIRGGGEYGPRWHLAALRENRPRAYEDFAAVATDLVTRGITEPARLGIEGGSNGGLLMGVMLTRYPELFGAVVATVPLLDLRRYHKLLAGASWMAEYGDPDDEADWAYLREFSPYHNVRAGRPYPPVLFVTSTRDDRVHPGHARKMVARLREHGYDVSYYENVEGGHGAAADNAQRAAKWALILEFLHRRLTHPA